MKKPNTELLNNKSIAFLGAGNMGAALMKGLLRSKAVKPSQITFHEPDSKRVSAIEKLGTRHINSNHDAARQADIVLICVKPDKVAPVLEEIESSALFISVAAGITTKYIEQKLHNKYPRVVRVMPNLPAVVGKGATAICSGKHATSRDVAIAKAIFSKVGHVLEAPERFFDAVTAISGSGPAYIFYLAEIMLLSAKQFKMPYPMASELVKHTIYGAGFMLAANGMKPEDLRLMVTSPGGTTEAAIKHLETNQVKNIFVEAINKACHRASELSK